MSETWGRIRGILVLNIEELILQMDPFYVSSTTVPTTYQMDGLKDHIRSMEDEKFIRLEQFVKLKESILNLYDELESEPSSELERFENISYKI